jgi:hypothetical protein
LPAGDLTTAAVKNLILAMNGEKPLLAQINPEVAVKKWV